MTKQAATNGDESHRYLSQMDDMSLADESAAQTLESDPDTLEVREDSMAILQDTMNEVRGPLLLVVALVGTAALVAVGVMMLRRAATRV